jgi:NitT/TauT family transport system substrate-binding protein
MTKLRSAILFVLAASAAVLPGCGKKDASPAGGPAKVVLALDWVPEPEFGGFYAARDGGSFKKQGLEVEIRGGGAGVPVPTRCSPRGPAGPT